MPGHSSPADSPGLREFFGLLDPRLPVFPASLLDGKEGVDGSSPSEGYKPLQLSALCCLLGRPAGADHGGVSEMLICRHFTYSELVRTVEREL
jgi:hypothetical protein